MRWPPSRGARCPRLPAATGGAAEPRLPPRAARRAPRRPAWRSSLYSATGQRRRRRPAMRVVIELSADGPERPPAGASVHVELRDTSYADAPAVTLASASGEATEAGDP